MKQYLTRIQPRYDQFKTKSDANKTEIKQWKIQNMTESKKLKWNKAKMGKYVHQIYRKDTEIDQIQVRYNPVTHNWHLSDIAVNSTHLQTLCDHAKKLFYDVSDRLLIWPPPLKFRTLLRPMVATLWYLKRPKRRLKLRLSHFLPPLSCCFSAVLGENWGPPRHPHSHFGHDLDESEDAWPKVIDGIPPEKLG